jgi:Carboxypeptidase regulatory-like domain
MRFSDLLCLLVLTAALAPCQTVTSLPATASAKESATVAGQVLRLDTGEPLKKAQVSLQSHTGDAFSDFRLTDEQGDFMFENVKPGPYDLHVERNGFLDAEYGQKKPGAPGAILTVSVGQRITDLVLKLARGASISGHVIDEDGEPVAHAEVIVYRAAHQSGKEVRNSYDSMSTNDLGEYRVFDLAPGRYFIAVNYRIVERNGRHSPFDRNNFNPGYLPTYYPNTTDAARAATITVNPGDEIRSIDFMMRPGHLVTVSGRVINAVPGIPPSGGGTVNLYPRASGLADAAQDLYSSFSSKDGRFSIANVPSGSYYLDAGWFDPDTRESHRARRALDVGTSDIEDITVTISRGIDIAGRVLWEGTPTPGAQDLFIRLRPMNEGEIGSQPLGNLAKSDGSFVLKNVSIGTYWPIISANGTSSNLFLKTIRYGTASVSESGFTVQSSSDVVLELILSSHVAQLSGVVLHSDSLPASGITVVLIPDPPRRNRKEHYKSVTSDQNGKFSIPGIAPGDYKVFSWDPDQVDPEEAEWFDAAWLQPYEPKGETVHLEESDNKSVNLILIETKPDSASAN